MGLYNKYGNNNDRMIVGIDADSGAVTTVPLADWYNDSWRGKQVIAVVGKATLKKIVTGQVLLEKDSAPFMDAAEIASDSAIDELIADDAPVDG